MCSCGAQLCSAAAWLGSWCLPRGDAAPPPFPSPYPYPSTYIVNPRLFSSSPPLPCSSSPPVPSLVDDPLVRHVIGVCQQWCVMVCYMVEWSPFVSVGGFTAGQGRGGHLGAAR